MVYSAADDVVLEKNMWFDVNEMELVGSTDQVNVIVQIDRYDGAFTRDGDWTEARRYRITQDTTFRISHRRSPSHLGRSIPGIRKRSLISSREAGNNIRQRNMLW